MREKSSFVVVRHWFTIRSEGPAMKIRIRPTWESHEDKKRVDRSGLVFCRDA